LDRGLGARGNASWIASLFQPVATHVALGDYAAFRLVLRSSVRTIPSAVLTADASVRAVQDDASRGIF
jgi:hypothetical protein